MCADKKISLLSNIYVQDLKDYPIIPGLPSYGRGRELPGPRYSSLINGDGLEDVIITGTIFKPAFSLRGSCMILADSLSNLQL